MTPKEKARELYGRFFRVTPQPYKEENISFNGNQIRFQEWDKDWTYEMSKQCALIAVDLCIDILDMEGYDDEDYKIRYWHQVKTEIENL